MKKILLLIGLLSTHLFIVGQNLIEYGNFEENNYQGGDDPTDYYSGQPCDIGLERFENDMEGTWWVANPLRMGLLKMLSGFN